jgi:hypothetical protein
VHVIHYHVLLKKCIVFVQEVKGAFKMYVSYRYSVSYSRGISITVFLDVSLHNSVDISAQFTLLKVSVDSRDYRQHIMHTHALHS